MKTKSFPKIPEYRSRRPLRIVVALVSTVTALLIATPTAMAALIAGEDFTYVSGTLASGSNSGGTGWSGAWTGNIRPQVLSTGNLSFSSIGYDVVQSGTGEVRTTSSTAAGVSSRSLASAITGSALGTDVWFSVLVRADSPATEGRAGVYFNISDTSSTAPRTSATAGFLLVGTSFRTLSGGTLAGTGSATLALNSTHLVVGKISLLDSGSSSILLWLDPANVTTVGNLGAETVSYSANFSGSITNAGVESYAGGISGGPGLVDALRIGSDLASVTAIPEPGSAGLIGLGLAGLFLSSYRKSNRRARVCLL